MPKENNSLTQRWLFNLLMTAKARVRVRSGLGLFSDVKHLSVLNGKNKYEVHCNLNTSFKVINVKLD